MLESHSSQTRSAPRADRPTGEVDAGLLAAVAGVLGGTALTVSFFLGSTPIFAGFEVPASELLPACACHDGEVMDTKVPNEARSEARSETPRQAPLECDLGRPDPTEVSVAAPVVIPSAAAASLPMTKLFGPCAKAATRAVKRTQPS